MGKLLRQPCEVLETMAANNNNNSWTPASTNNSTATTNTWSTSTNSNSWSDQLNNQFESVWTLGEQTSGSGARSSSQQSSRTTSAPARTDQEFNNVWGSLNQTEMTAVGGARGWGLWWQSTWAGVGKHVELHCINQTRQHSLIRTTLF